jgi:hypothetical protein
MKTRTIILSGLLFFLCAPGLSASPVDDARAQAIIKQARAAIGIDDPSKLQGLTFKGDYQRSLGSMQMSGEREVSIQLPDKYLAEDSMTMGIGGSIVTITHGLNAEHAWSRTDNNGGGAAGGMMMVMRNAGPGGKELTAEQSEAMYRRMNQGEFSRYALALLLSPPSSISVEYKYAGNSDVEGIAADVIEITGPEKLAFKLFLDKQTHMPLLLSYRDRKPRIMTRSIGGDKGKPEEALKKAREDAEKEKSTMAPATPEEADFFIRMTDYRQVGTMKLPYKLTFLTDNDVTEELQISRYELNPKFKASKFQKS